MVGRDQKVSQKTFHSLSNGSKTVDRARLYYEANNSGRSE